MLKKKVLILTLIISVVFSSGCNLVQVNPEKDMSRVVAKIDDEEIPKKEFIKLFTYYEMTYQLNGYQLPEGEELETLKEELLDSFVEIELITREAQKDKVEIDEEALKEEIDTSIETLKSGFEEEKEYIEFIEERNLTQVEFEQFLDDYITAVYYSNDYLKALQEDLFESGKEAEKTIVTVDGEKLRKDEFYYYLSQMELSYYANYGQGMPTDETSLKTIYSQLQSKVAESTLVRDACKEKGFDLKESEVKKQAEGIKSDYKNLFGDDFSQYLKSYYITEDRFEELIKSDASTSLYEQALKEEFNKDTKVTDKEISEYYEENKNSYDTSTVSAKHILTESEEFANKLSKEIKDVDSFETAFEKYADDENVSEASDLGEFKKGQMVAEFEDAAFNMKKGEVSEPVKSQYGYHIIYVYENNQKPIPTLKEKTEEIREQLISEKVNTKLSEYKSDLISDSDIKNEDINEPFDTIIEDLKEVYKVKTYPDVL